MKEGESIMGKRLNEAFLESYLELDSDCAAMMNVPRGGVTEYINKLSSTRLAPDRDAVLPKLIKYRAIRNKLAHEAGALRKENEISKRDLKWIRKFKKDIQKQRDQLSIYLVKEGGKKKKPPIKFIIAVILALLLAALAYYLTR